MKKRTALLICILTLALLLAGCGGEEKAVSGSVKPLETTVPETTAPVVEENPLSLGRLVGGEYTNEYIGLGCTLDENWEFYAAEELQELPEIVTEALEGSDLVGEDGMPDQITDMMAENLNDLTTMNLLYTKLSMQERLAYAVMTEETLIDITLEQKDDMIAAYAQMGIEVFSIEKDTVTFLGEERCVLRTEASIEGVPYYTLQMFDYNLGQYYTTLTLASYLEDNTDSLLDLWYSLG